MIAVHAEIWKGLEEGVYSDTVVSDGGSDEE